MSFLAAIIYFSVYLEHWAYTRSQKQEEMRTRKNIMMFIKDDLEQRLHFIDESLQYKDYWYVECIASRQAYISNI